MGVHSSNMVTSTMHWAIAVLHFPFSKVVPTNNIITWGLCHTYHHYYSWSRRYIDTNHHLARGCCHEWLVIQLQLSQWPYIITLKNCTFWDKKKKNLFTNIFSSNTFSSIIHPFIFFKFRVAGELKLIPAVFGWKAQGTRAQHISIMTKHSQFIGSFLCFCFVFCYTL